MSSYFSGHVHTVIFENDVQDFYILRVRLDDTSDDAKGFGFDLDSMFNETTVVAKGNIPGMKPRTNTWIGFEGNWVTHEKFGRQIQITRAPVIKEWTARVAVSMLTSAGVGGRIARRMAKHLEHKFVPALDEGDEEALTVPEVTSFMAQHAISKWREIKSFHKTLDFLANSGVARGLITKVWAAFGDDAREVLTTNPWAMVEIDGVKFPQCDEVARKLGLGLDTPLRHQGAVLYVCKTARGMGHVFMSTGEVRQAAQAFVADLSARQVAEALGALHKTGKLVIDQKTRPGMVAVYEPWLYQMEQQSAELLRKRFDDAAFDDEDLRNYAKRLSTLGPQAEDAYTHAPGDLRAIARAALEDLSVGSTTKLSPDQMEGAVNALVEPASILTGLPGTGKTTTLNVVVNALRDAGASILLIAPTGIAAKRLATVTGAEAATIHRAFGAKGFGGEEREANYHGIVENPHAERKLGSDGSIEHWSCSEAPHPADVVICDESSMVDQHLMYRILTCTKPTARLVFVGDAAQLPSVGPGNVLREMISSDLLPTVNLIDIFRQDDTSDIVLAAHDIHSGNVPKASRSKESDFNLIPIGREDKILSAVVRVAQTLLGDEQFQIISPKHGGTLGVTNLNAKLREVLNPRQPGLNEMKLGNETLREGDRVMVVKNDYDLGVFNGDVGKVVQLHRRDREVEIKIHGPPVMHVRVPFKKAAKMLRLAYAMTVHKCVHPDTLVETSEGLLPIKSISSVGYVATPEGRRPYRNKVTNPEGPAVRITTRGGYSLTVTPDHGVDVWDGEQYVRREAGDIQQGDLLRMFRGTTLEPTVDPTTLLPGAPPHDVRSTSHSIPVQMDGDVAEFLGLMVADGTVYSKGFRLAKRHADTVDRFVELCASLFGVGVRRYQTGGAHHAEVNSTFLSSWLSAVGGLDPHDKSVPLCVLRSPSHVQAKFLRGLFADGSVHVKGECLDHIEWTCKFDALPDVVRTMLLRFGIPCGTARGRGIHTVYIYGKYAQRFGEIIGFLSEFKQRRLLLPCGNQTKYFVPLSRSEARALRRDHLDVLGHSTCGNVVQRGRMSLHSLDLLLNKSGADSDVVHTLRDRAVFHHEPVVSVEATSCPSMCVEVPEGHRFLQNGFSAWNSQGQEYNVIVMPLVRAFAHQLQRNLLYTAITRAKKRVVLVGHGLALERAVNNSRVDARNTLLLDRMHREWASAEGPSDLTVG